MIVFKKCSPFEPDVSRLIDELDAFQVPLYPPGQSYADPREKLALPDCHLLAAYKDEGILGIGAVKLCLDYGEIKRVYVTPAARGIGVAKKIMQELESHLLRSGIRCARLETGLYHTEALALYRSIGYQKIGAFGDYPDDPLCVFMEKLF